MEDDAQALARWQSACPEQFVQCEERGISAFKLLNALQRFEAGDIASIEMALAEVIQQQKIRQDLVEQQQQQQQASREARGTTDTQSDVADVKTDASPDDERLPAWVGLEEEMNERRNLVWHALASAFTRLAGDAIDDPERVDTEVRAFIKVHLRPLEELVLSFSTAAGEAEEEIAKRLGTLVEEECDAACKKLADSTVHVLRNLTEQKAGSLHSYLIEASAEALSDLTPNMAQIISRSVALPTHTMPAADSLLQKAVDCFDCPVCQGTASTPVTTSCGHSYCESCFHKTAGSGDRKCPSCRKSIQSLARRIKGNSVQNRVLGLLAEAQRPEAPPLDLAAVRKHLTCGACRFVLRDPITTPSGHTFCKACFGVLSSGSGGLLLEHIVDAGDAKFALQLRFKLEKDTVLGALCSLLFPAERARVPDAVRERKLQGEPLDGRKRLMPPRLLLAKVRARKEREPELSWEEAQARKKEREAAKVAELVAAGKDVYRGERDNSNMPDLTGKTDEKGRPLFGHNRSCHICTQGNASWRGGFFQPLGCSQCVCIFCPRCLGNIMKKPYTEHKEEIDAFIKDNMYCHTCIVCNGGCACQDPAYAAVKISSSRSVKREQVFTTEGPFGFDSGDKVTVRGHTSGSADDSKLGKTEWTVRVISTTEFALKDKDGASLDLKKTGKGGQIEMTKLQKHKKRGLAGATGYGIRKDAPHGQKYKAPQAATPAPHGAGQPAIKPAGRKGAAATKAADAAGAFKGAAATKPAAAARASKGAASSARAAASVAATATTCTPAASSTPVAASAPAATSASATASASAIASASATASAPATASASATARRKAANKTAAPSSHQDNSAEQSIRGKRTREGEEQPPQRRPPRPVPADIPRRIQKLLESGEASVDPTGDELKAKELREGMLVWGEFKYDRVWYPGTVRPGTSGPFVDFDDGELDSELEGRRWRQRDSA